MKRRAWWVLFVGLLEFGCGRNITQKKLDEPCTRTDQCEVGLACMAGVCLPVDDAGVDGGS